MRQAFRDELGMDPGAELQRLHRLILSRDPELDRPGGAPRAPATGAAPTPRELPAEASCFVGRERELARVCRVLRPAGWEARRRPAVMVLYGPGGMGKSALAVRAGHHLADEFRDGQLYVDLFGSTPGMRPLPAVEVLGRLLRSLRVHPAEVPSTEVEAASLFRSLTADRRLLLVLDNAADRDQVAPLVPSTPGCAVLVTSRQPLPTLDADDRLWLDRLPDRDALALLTGLTAGRAMAAEAAQRIVAHSGGLPLAVRVAAGRRASRPDLPAHEYAARLSEASRRLDELQLDDLAVRACIRTGYDAVRGGGDPMGELAARAFRALGLLQVPDVAPGVVAAMLAVPEFETARAALDRLVDAQLLEPVQSGRYRLHDLVRLVATELATDEDSPADREQILHRAIAFYTIALWRTQALLHPGRVLPYPRPPILEGEFLPSFQERAPASAWIDQELPSLVAAFEQAATSIAGGSARSLLWYGHTLWLHLDARCDWLTAYQVSRLMRLGETVTTSWRPS